MSRGDKLKEGTLWQRNCAAEIAALDDALTAYSLTSGVYTPNLTNVANLDGSTAYQCQYMRVGSVVTVSGRVDMDATLTATVTQLDMTLPIASDLGTNDCAGVAACTTIASLSAGIFAEATGNKARFQFVSVGVANDPFLFTFTYRIV